jgi:hypothetical protein
MSIKHAKTSAAGTSADPAKVGGDDWNAGHVIDVGGINLPAAAAAPATPDVDTMQFYAQKLAGGPPLPAFVTPAGIVQPLQPFLGRNVTTLWIAAWGAPNPMATFGNLNTSVGSAVSYLPDFTINSMYTALPRFGISSSATAGSVGRYSTNTPDCCRNTAVGGYGGFRVIARFGTNDAAAVAGARQFVGLSMSTFTTDPINQVCIVGVGCDSGDTELSLYTNDFSGTATKVPLGANFPAHVAKTDLYELAMYCPRDGSSITVTLTRLNTGHTASSVLISDLPQSATGLYFIFQRGNGPTALSTRIDIFGLYIEKEY